MTGIVGNLSSRHDDVVANFADLSLCHACALKVLDFTYGLLGALSLLFFIHHFLAYVKVGTGSIESLTVVCLSLMGGRHLLVRNTNGKMGILFFIERVSLVLR